MLSFFLREVCDEIWDLIGSVSEGFPTYFCNLVINYRPFQDGTSVVVPQCYVCIWSSAIWSAELQCPLFFLFYSVWYFKIENRKK